MNLQAFMMQNARPVENVKKMISDRFVDEEGKIIPFEIRAITTEEESLIRKSCMVEVTVKKHMKMKQVNQEAFMAKLSAKCVVYPDLKNEELQNSYGVRGDEELLKVMLLPGEYAELLNAVQEINGYSKDMNELVEEAKN